MNPFPLLSPLQPTWEAARGKIGRVSPKDPGTEQALQMLSGPPLLQGPKWLRSPSHGVELALALSLLTLSAVSFHFWTRRRKVEKEGRERKGVCWGRHEEVREEKR